MTFPVWHFTRLGETVIFPVTVATIECVFFFCLRAIELAGKFYNMMGYRHREGFEYWKSPHPLEQLVFEMAVQAF
ncbi:hypothetical protein ABLA30_12145, partial [Xenorhabdus nematophila]